MKITRHLARTLILGTTESIIEESIGKGNYEAFVHWAQGGRCEFRHRDGRWSPTFDPDCPEWNGGEYRPAPAAPAADLRIDTQARMLTALEARVDAIERRNRDADASYEDTNRHNAEVAATWERRIEDIERDYMDLAHILNDRIERTNRAVDGIKTILARKAPKKPAKKGAKK